MKGIKNGSLLRGIDMWLWLAVVLVSGVGGGQQNGQPCSCDTDCDLNKWLRCERGKCVCLSSSFHYDYERKSCVVKLGHKCFEVVTDLAHYKHLPPYIKCVDGAFCSIAVGGLCACNTYAYYESDDGERCEEKKYFGTKCGRSGECKSDACQGGQCTCREGYYYNSEREKCLGLVGSYCFTDEDCTPQAICNEEAVCSCGLGYSPTNASPALHCTQELKWGAGCNTTCNNPTLSCHQHKCVCKYPQAQVLEGDECKALVKSAPCKHHTHCVQNSHCHIEDGGFSECRCNPGFLELADGSCLTRKSHGESCEKDEECDPVTPLLCVNGACGCGDGLTSYNKERRICLGLHGWRGCASDADCVEGALCLRSNPNLPPKCMCPYKASKQRTCTPPTIT